ncbi:MAG: TetR/AcrR family transcriptional regulator [Spirochaetaceae bacterium]|jgi:AcrR family transcriptional regulator|nr:TetR/AcrR family transcriptional regulator [Spirochaetaceae bacterium]
MSIVVEHEKRRREILDNALDVFIEEGYDEVTFQKIAGRCGITRTTLYIYFKSKRDLFIGAIRQLTGSVETKIKALIQDEGISNREKLRRTMRMIFEACMENRKLFQVTIVYLLRLKTAGKSPSERVRRRTIRLRHLLSSILIEGINRGEFRGVNIKRANEILFALVETLVFRLAVYDRGAEEALVSAADLVIDSITA